MKSLNVYSLVFFLYKKTLIIKHEKQYLRIPLSEQNKDKTK